MMDDDYIWPDGGVRANFADDAGDDYGMHFIDPDGSEQGPLSGQFLRQLAVELENPGKDQHKRPNGAILLRRIADDYDGVTGDDEEDEIPGPGTRLGRARVWLHKMLPNGTTCPLCGQNAKVYRRNLNSGMAVALLTMVAAEQSPGQWLHKPTVLRGVASAARDESLLRFWGLLEEQKELRPDGGRAGYWRVTGDGWRWAHGKIEVPKYVDVYNGRPRGAPYGPSVSIDDALGEGFDRAALLAAPARAD